MAAKKADLLRVHLRVQPGSSKKEIIYYPGRNSTKKIKVYLNAPPEKGKANKELVKFLAGKLNISKSNIRIISGERSKDKVIEIKGVSATDFLKIIKDGKS